MTGTPANEFFNNIEGQENMGRGERSKKKRRFRSLSPVGRGTPGAGGGSGYGGQDGGLQEGYVSSFPFLTTPIYGIMCIRTSKLTTNTVSDKRGAAHTAGSGEPLFGLFATDPKAHVPSAITAATSMNAIRNSHHGARICSITRGHSTRFNSIGRNGESRLRHVLS